MSPTNPTLTDETTLTITISALTVHAAFSRLWISPPGTGAWQEMKAVATGGQTPPSVTYEVTRQSFLAWRLSVGSARKRVEPYRVALTLTQHGRLIMDGVLLIEGMTGGGGTALTEGFVQLL